MFTYELYLDESKITLVKQHRRSIENLFSVTCKWSSLLRDQSDSENGSSPVDVETATLQLSSQYSQESVKKAKNFIGILTTEGKDFQSAIEELSEEELNMVLENKNTIENKSHAFLDFIESSKELCIYGNTKNVCLAQTLVERMRNHINKPQYRMCTTETIYCRENSDLHCIGSTQTGSNEIPLTQRQESLQTDGAPLESYLFSGYGYMDESNSSHDGDVIVSPDNESSNDNFSFGASSSQIKSSHSISSHSDDENDEEVDQIIHDTSNRTKIEFALKLGYSQSQIATVIRRLGANIGQNEMLSELIKIGMSSPLIMEDEGSETEESLKSSESSVPFLSYYSDQESSLRPIVIDGSNVAMSHGNKEVFSCRGIELAVDWFKQRGHTQITVFVPQWRKETSRADPRITDQEILSQLEKEKILVFTPARRIGGKRVVCYDDRYILKLAAENDGVVVSNDNYRDLINEKPEYKKVVEERLLMFSFVNDRFMPPDDPLGRHGPSLDNFLSCQPQTQENLPPPCPYGSKKCTYGNKCKYYHPERGNIPQKSVSDKLAEQAKQKLQEVRARAAEGADKKKQIARKPKMSLQRTKSLATDLPADLVSDQIDKDFQKLSVEDVVSKDSEKDEKWKQYDEKLSEHRRKLEKAEQEEKRRQEEELRKQKEAEYFKTLADDARSNTPSPSNRLSPAPIRPQEQFLSGHLLLAKKLSDEANESKLRRGPEEHTYTKSPLAATQSQPVITSPIQPTPPQLQHKKLSRQFSLQGAQDPRLKPNVRQQVSYDPNMLFHHSRVNQAYAGGPYRQSTSLSPGVQQPFDQAQFYSEEEKHFTHSSNYASESYSHRMKENHGNFLSPDSYLSHHMALTRMQSAPEVAQHIRENPQPVGRPINKMTRQNSSSDTQLHVHGGEAEPFNNFFSQSNVERTAYTKRQDSVTYNIGSQNLNEQYRRSSSTIGQYHYQSDQSYSQHPSLSHDPRWTFPDQGYQESYGMGQPTTVHGFQPMHDRDTTQQFTSLRSRGSQIWPNTSNTQPSSFRDLPSEPYQQSRLSIPSSADFTFQSQMNTLSEGFGDQSRHVGVPVLGAQTTAAQTPNYQPIPPTDKRYGLYYHLCALFPEHKVRAVMNQYPDVNNPQELCAYLIGAK